MSEPMWMVRSEGGALFERFSQGYVAIGWAGTGDLGRVVAREEIRSLYEKAYPEDGPGKATNSIAALYKIRGALRPGHKVVTYDPAAREYLVGEVTSDYQFDETKVGAEWPHVRAVHWDGRIDRDDLSPSTRNTLGSTLTLFSINEDASAEILEKLGAPGAQGEPLRSSTQDDLSSLKEDESAKALELVKDAIVALSPDEAEELVASLLRAMGYRARVTPTGPDRGVDVIASPDGLGLEEPRIKAEVKHRPKTAIGSQEVRSFLGGLRQGDRGLYVSTGGFTKEARYEAERSSVPVTLVTLDDLTDLVVTHYEGFDVDGRVILPLVRVYIPAR